jgi:hypothetical protein
MHLSRRRTLQSAALTVLIASAGHAQSIPDLASYFGFTDAEITKVGDDVGPLHAVDVDGDDLVDLIAVNNRQSRIDVYYQKKDASPGDVTHVAGVNELPPHWRFRHEELTLSHRVTAVRTPDMDGDGVIDLLLATASGELVVMRQESPGRFSIATEKRVRGLAARQGGLAYVDVMGDETPEVCVLVSGAIHVFPVEPGPRPRFGEATVLSSDDNIMAFFPDDYDGDGKVDLMGIIAEHEAPLRLWRQRTDREGGYLGPELRFEMPPLREAEVVRFPDRDAASMAVIERVSRRLAVYDVVTEPIDPTNERDVQSEVFGFTNPRSRDRDVEVGDVDGDGLLDVVATDADANAVAIFRQARGRGLMPAELNPSLKDLSRVSLGAGPDDTLRIAVLSEDEEVVGVSTHGDDGLAFPQSVSISTAGAEPVAMSLVELGDGPMIAMVVKRKRDHFLEMHPMSGGDATIVELEGVDRPPATLLACDADQDGRPDLLLLTPNERMTMVRAAASGLPEQVLTDELMPHFGLVSAASAVNTSLLDVDGDGKAELIFAAENFVRACRYDVEEGWQVVQQVNAADPMTEFVSLAVMQHDGASTIVAADGQNNCLLMMGKDGGRFRVQRTIDLVGFDIRAIFTGSFSGDGEPNVLCVGDAGFAIVRLAGDRLVLRQIADYRPDDEDIMEHEIEVGDVNGDGYVDMVVLDAGKQLLEILTFSTTRTLYHATAFEIFESRLFDGGGGREFEPRQAIIADVTGDGADDVVVLVHDRFIVYPQMTAPAD